MKKRILSILFAILIISSMGGLIPAASAIDVSNYTMLNIPWEYIQECGSQSVSNQTTACQAYAWAYCRIILDNKLYNWSNYWDFSAGKATNPIVAGYNNVINDPNEQTILKGIYDNINIGRPVVLRARGSNGYNFHYVVAVGYKIDCDPQKLLQSDILILDPWDGTTKSLTTIPLKANQDSNYGYWTAQSGGVSITTTGAFSNLPYFTCNVRISCFNSQTVNLYNNPGDASRATYFSLGQIVNSTCGMVRSDGSTWYQITANHNGTPKTFWLKYESGKMTVTNLMSKGPYTLTPKCAPGTCLDVKGGSADDGANVQIYTSNGTAAQQWELTYLGNGYYTIISKASGKALDVAGASTESGTNVQQYTPNGTNAQQWMLKDAGEGYYYIVPRVNTGLCLDVAGAGTADKTNVEIYTANGTDAQKWKLTAPEISYTVTFNPNGGSISQSSKTVTTGQKYGDLPMPSRSGYIFDGWYTSANGGTQVTAATTVNLTGNQTLYAQWKINCFNHTYDADTCTNCGARLPYDNGFDASAAGTYQVSENTAYIRTGPYQVKDLVRTMSRGETLRVIGSVINSYNNIWMKTADGYYVHADKLTLYSETQAQSYYVILDDGSVCSRITVTNGETYGNLPTPAKEGYTFDGWYTAASGGVRVTASTTVSLTNNQTLYAQWSRIPTGDGYTITFNADGGECSIDTMKTNAEGKLSSLPIPTRDNCTFGGWRMIVGGSELWRDVDTNTVFTKNTKVYASWIYGSCTVFFDANGGTVSQDSKSVTTGTTYGDLPTPARNGYKFDGWYTAASGGIRMTSNTIVDATVDHTLYAHWSANPTQTTWGTWSAWSTTPYSASSTRQVETQQVKVSDAYTEYRYGLWRNASNASWCPDYGASLSSSGGSWYESYSNWSTTRMYQDTGHNAFCSGSNHNHTHVSGYDSSGRANWHIYSDDGTFTGWGRLYYYWEETRTIPATYETQYRYRDLISA